jgi:steroid 5-alpha reductase family enzyme
MGYLETCDLGAAAILGLMIALLLRVSGVALVEKTLVQIKLKYKEYVESTSAFIPWFPGKRKGGGAR